MEILFLLIPLSVLVMAVAIGIFLWAIKAGQFDDLEGPAHRILMDDDDPRIPHKHGAAQDENGEPSLKQEKR